jgi:type VI secretion system secreted protein VgrG
MSGKEALSTVSEFEVQCVSPSPDLEATDVLGKSFTIEIITQEKNSRYLDGLVTQFTYIGPDGSAGKQYKYKAKLQSWLHLADLRSDCKIHLQKDVPTIIKDTLGEFGLPLEMKLMDSYSVRENTVMYGETSLNFVKRLAEEVGIYFYVKHDLGSHTICFTDGGHTTLPEYSTIEFLTPGSRPMDADEYITEWEVQHDVKSGSYVTNSYNFKAPDARNLKIDADEKGHTNDSLEMYEWHGGYPDLAEGSKLARVRREQQQLDFQTITATTNVRGIAPGYYFKLTDHPTRKANAEYLIVGADYFFQENSNTSRSDGQETTWSITFNVKPSADRYQPPRVTAKPRIVGPHSAKISGPKGQEIFCDQYGRVKVQFPWDRYGKNDENSSCWIRVSSPWAGANFGGMHVPRIGQEVMVEFLHGDPDLPIITSRVYNQNQMPPWDLPANATQSGFLSRSSPGGQYGNANAIRFEDKKGAEQVWIQAERNMDTVVENDETHHVMHDRTKTIDHDETVYVHHDRTETVDNNETITVHNNRQERVDQNETISIGVNRTEDVGANEKVTIGANKEQTIAIAYLQNVGAAKMTNVGGAYLIDVGGAMNRLIGLASAEEVGLAKVTKVGQGHSMTVGKDQKVEVGGDQSVTVAKTITINAGDSIEFVCGKSTLKMTKDGTISINGHEVDIGTSGDQFLKADGNITIKGANISEN